MRAWGPTLAELVPPAVEGFYATIGQIVAVGGLHAASGAAAESALDQAVTDEFASDPGARQHGAVLQEYAFDGDDPALLVRDLLAKLLVEFERHSRRAVAVAVGEFTPQRLRAAVTLAPVDAARSEFDREVKAVTYHELAIRPRDGGHELTYIVDI